MDAFQEGFIVGILVGEGHFGGDGRKPQITLRMHTRHREMFEWLVATVPGSRLYGPYHHGGRSYYQWMARGRSLQDQLLPILARRLAFLDEHVRSRIQLMCSQYGLPLTDERPPSG
jgi:hypothetical protein